VPIKAIRPRSPETVTTAAEELEAVAAVTDGETAVIDERGRPPCCSAFRFRSL